MSSSSLAMAAKAKAMYGAHLKASDYQELLRKNTVQEIAAYLKHADAFRDSLEGINEQTIHRGFLEILVRQEFFIDFLKLIHYGDMQKSKFYRFGIISIEIRQILVTLRSLGERDRSAQLAQLPIFASKQMSFDLESLIKIQTYEELLKVLKSTPYAAILRPYHPIDTDDIDYVACEVALKKYFFDWMNELIDETFSGSDHKQLKDLFNSRMELENLTVVYRLKKYYRSNPAKIREFLNLISVHIPRKQLEEWIDQKDAEGFLMAIKDSFYHIEFETKDILHIENLVDRIQHKLNKKMLRVSSNPDIVLVAYLNLLEIEIRNVIDIIEGVRYHVDKERIARLLIY